MSSDKTEVVNLRFLPSGWENDPTYVYIGRCGHGHDGYLGNPHPVGFCPKCTDRTGLHTVHVRGEALAEFKKDFEKRVVEDKEYRHRVESLRGKKLVCFCHPLPCHSNVYVDYNDGLQEQEDWMDEISPSSIY